MGKPSRGNALLSLVEYIDQMRRTGGSEPSQYPQEQKVTTIPLVAASGRGRAQTDDCVGSLQALQHRGRGICHRAAVTALQVTAYS